jgi:hypothetical protein
MAAAEPLNTAYLLGKLADLSETGRSAGGPEAGRECRPDRLAVTEMLEIG